MVEYDEIMKISNDLCNVHREAYMKNTVIFDLDGTLAIIDKRISKASSTTGNKPVRSKMDWDVFFDA